VRYRDHADHYYFRKVPLDGTVLLTKVSHALGKEIPGHLFQEIIHHQLMITKGLLNPRLIRVHPWLENHLNVRLLYCHVYHGGLAENSHGFARMKRG